MKFHPFRIAIAFALVAFTTQFRPAAAQDFEAIQRRLGGAVEAGELSLAQALHMFEALHEFHEHEMHDREEHFEAFVEEIQEAVEAGKLSEEEAERKMIEVRREMFGDHDDHGDHDEEHDHMEEKKERYMAFVREIKQAVEEGDLSEEDAERKMIEVRREMFGQKKPERRNDDQERQMDIRKQRYKMAIEKIKAAVKEGDLSPEDGRKRMAEMKQAMAKMGKERKTEQPRKRKARDRGTEEASPKSDRSARDREDPSEVRARRQRFANAQKQIEAAVKNGDMTREQAQQKLEELKKALFRK